MIKARPVAGDLALGARVPRRTRAVHLAQIFRLCGDRRHSRDEAADPRGARPRARSTVAGHDVKLGRGGIREIEFFVQTQQLIFGGRRPTLRGARTLDMLRELCARGLGQRGSGRGAFARLSSICARVEHRLQMIADEQTQRLPFEDEALAPLRQILRLCAASPASRAISPSICARSRSTTRGCSRTRRSSTTDAGSLVFTGVVDDPETLATLQRLGFQRPEAGDRDDPRLAFRPPPGGAQRARARGADGADAGPARRLRRLRRSRRRARRVRRRADAHAGGGRADVDPALQRRVARIVRRSARRRAAARRGRRLAAARARRGDRSRPRAAIADGLSTRRRRRARVDGLSRAGARLRGRARTARATSPPRRSS